jgi:hypothetical protein
MCTAQYSAAFPEPAAVPAAASMPAATSAPGMAAAQTSPPVSADFGEHIVLQSTSPRLAEVRVPSHQALPRLGVQDSRGLAIPDIANQLSQELRRSLQRRETELANATMLYQLLVLTRLLDDEYEAMDRSRLSLFVPSNQLLPVDSGQLATQLHMLGVLAYAVSDAGFQAYFRCSSTAQSCSKYDVMGRVNQQAQFAGGASVALSQRQAIFDDFMRVDFEPLLELASTAPLDAYMVGRLTLGEYETDRGQWVVMDRPDASIKPSVPTISPISWLLNPDDPYLRTASPEPHFPMAAAEAEGLIDRLPEPWRRQLYAVTRIRLEGAIEASPQQIFLKYVAASPEVNLYIDEALTQHVATITLDDMSVDDTRKNIINAVPPTTWEELSNQLETVDWRSGGVDRVTADLSIFEVQRSIEGVRTSCAAMPESSAQAFCVQNCRSTNDVDMATLSSQDHSAWRNHLKTCLTYHQRAADYSLPAAATASVGGGVAAPQASASTGASSNSAITVSPSSWQELSSVLNTIDWRDQDAARFLVGLPAPELRQGIQTVVAECEALPSTQDSALCWRFCRRGLDGLDSRPNDARADIVRCLRGRQQALEGRE